MDIDKIRHLVSNVYVEKYPNLNVGDQQQVGAIYIVKAILERIDAIKEME